MKRNLGVIIVAAGSGSRMGSKVPKQFLKVGGEYVLVRSLKAFVPYSDNIVVVVSEQEADRWDKIVRKCGLEGTHKVCFGGSTRFESVKNGLSAVGECRLTAVHDGARPLVSAALIETALDTAERNAYSLPLVEPVDSFRIATENGAESIDRSLLRAVQTPQIFLTSVLKKAYGRNYKPAFTDEATVVEASGFELSYCQGEKSNIKITSPEDLLIAEAFLKSRREP